MGGRHLSLSSPVKSFETPSYENKKISPYWGERQGRFQATVKNQSCLTPFKFECLEAYT